MAAPLADCHVDANNYRIFVIGDEKCLEKNWDRLVLNITASVCVFFFK